MGGFNSKVANDGKSVHRSARGNIGSAKDSHRFSLRLDVGDSGVSIKTLTFRHVMKEPLGREYFMIFLKLEHAEENLIFFEECYFSVVFVFLLCTYFDRAFSIYDFIGGRKIQNANRRQVAKCYLASRGNGCHVFDAWR